MSVTESVLLPPVTATRVAQEPVIQAMAYSALMVVSPAICSLLSIVMTFLRVSAAVITTLQRGRGCSLMLPPSSTLLRLFLIAILRLRKPNRNRHHALSWVILFRLPKTQSL